MPQQQANETGTERHYRHYQRGNNPFGNDRQQTERVDAHRDNGAHERHGGRQDHQPAQAAAGQVWQCERHWPDGHGQHDRKDHRRRETDAENDDPQPSACGQDCPIEVLALRLATRPQQQGRVQEDQACERWQRRERVDGVDTQQHRAKKQVDRDVPGVELHQPPDLGLLAFDGLRACAHPASFAAWRPPLPEPHEPTSPG